MADDMPSFFWLSFVDSEAKPPRSLGCTVVCAETMKEAVVSAHRFGINPGGEVMGLAIIDDGTVNANHLAFMLNTLRSRAEIETQGITSSPV